MRVNKRSPVPLYYQLAESIRERIETGELVKGERLPSETDLSRESGVSRMTARQAISYLSSEGLLTVRPGVGTFVAEPKLTQDALHLLGFTERMMMQGEMVVSDVLEQGLVEAPQRVAAQLRLSAGDRVVKIVRLRRANDVPLLLETSFVVAELCLGLENEDLTGQSLYELLERRYGLSLERSRHSLEARAAGEYEGRLFGVGAGTGVMMLEGVTYGERDRAVEFFEAVYRGDRFKFTLESRREGLGESSAQPQVGVVLVGGESRETEGEFRA